MAQISSAISGPPQRAQKVLPLIIRDHRITSIAAPNTPIAGMSAV